MRPGDRVTHRAAPELIGIVRKMAGNRALIRWTEHTSSWCARHVLMPCSLIHKPTIEKEQHA